MKKIYILLSMALVFGSVSLKAQITDLYDFSTNSYPYADVTVAGNKLFGAAYEGGANGFGYFFSVNKDGSGFKDIWDCYDTGTIAGNSNGTYPYGDVTIVKDKLYGFNYGGGAFGYGNIFRIDTDGNGYKDLYDFSQITGGDLGWGALTLIGNKFFGMGAYGGANNYGVIFSIDTDGTNYKDIFDFDNVNGGYPYSTSLAVYKNKLYGMTYEGGVNDSGVIFSIDTDGNGYKDLVDLNYSKGYYPDGFLTLIRNKLYGMTYQGGSHDSGVVFSVDTSGAAYANLVDMDSATGYYTYGALTQSGSKLYGMLYSGGMHDSGVVFSIDTNGTGYKHIYDFGGSYSAFYPYGNNITVVSDTLYGMTYDGGLNGAGELFRLQDTSIFTSVNNVRVTAGIVNIYPNPSNGRFNVFCNSPSGNVMIMEVYNVIGEKIYTGSLKNANNQVDLSVNSKGVYMYKVVTLEGAIVKEGKIVLE